MKTNLPLLIGDDIELNDNTERYLVRYYPDTNLFKCIPYNEANNVIYYELLKKPDELTYKEKRDILDYCLGIGNYIFEKEDVIIRDIFLHGKFIKKI